MAGTPSSPNKSLLMIVFLKLRIKLLHGVGCLSLSIEGCPKGEQSGYPLQQKITEVNGNSVHA